MTILFRAKAINRNDNLRSTYKNGDWVYGLVTRLYDEDYKNLPAEMIDINGISGIEVDHTTIGQFIGKIDKNNNMVFTGDITAVEGEDIYGIVKYREDKAAFFVENNQDGDYVGETWDTDVVVVGNIYDNSELLNI